MKILKIIFFTLFIVSCTTIQQPSNNPMNYSDKVLEKAKAIHNRVLVLDTHVDISVSNFTADKNYTKDIGNQVNLPNMEAGGLDVAWFIVYTGQGELTPDGYDKAYENAISKFDAIERLTKEIAPQRIGLAVSSKEARELHAEGKKIAMIGVENAYPLGTDISRVKEFYDRGARYMSLSHNGHSQFCDSNTGEKDSLWIDKGVSNLGKQVIKEMNKWGMMIDVSHPSKQSIKDIDLNQIKPNRFQPRQAFDELKINELSLSIAKHGILSPILVRETGAGGYELIAGERRLRAAKKAGLQTAPCLVDNAEDQLSLELALIENLQREDLNPVEEAKGYDRLKREFNLTQDNIAEVTGKARSSIANSMRLLNLPQSIIDLLYSGDLEKGHAKILASMESSEAEGLAKKIVTLGLTVKDAAANKAPKKHSKQQPKTKNRDLLNIEQDLSENLGHKTEIDQQSQSKGRILISYSSKDERENIISKLLKLKKN